MWVMTSFGVLMPSLRPANTIDPGDNRVIQVRARRRQDLDILREQYMGDDLGPVIFMKNTDYEFRAYCTRAAWARAMAAMSLDIDYTKFKPSTEEKYNDRQLHALYNQIWGVVQRHLSTYTRQRSYWGLDRKRPARRAKRDDWDAEWSEDSNAAWEQELLDLDTSDVDEFTTGPDLRPNGTLDHSACGHLSKGARKRCTRKWRRENKI